MEEWIDADPGIIVSRTVADGNLINAVTSPHSESKTLEIESTDEEIVRENFFGRSYQRVFYTSAVNQTPAMLLGTGRNAATYFAFHFFSA
jgi:hypothetical protein